jgi:ubiquinone/menaquinone biosynthesis C-methylase UbiE
MNIVEAHYAEPGLLERVREAIQHSGLDPDRLHQADLDKFDQFHVGGLNATNRLAELAEIRQSDRVLDLGSGIGGPSRHLAATLGCHVIGLDLTAEYCEVASMLAHSTGLADLVQYQQGDALLSPFDDQSFDVVWTQHAAMNIEDKPALYREIFRLLKKGGRLAEYDIVAGAGPVRYPVPWASSEEISFLISQQDMSSALAIVGFRNLVSEDVTNDGIEALRRLAASAGSPGFGLRTLMGPQFPTMIANLSANLRSGACRVVQATCVTE